MLGNMTSLEQVRQASIMPAHPATPPLLLPNSELSFDVFFGPMSRSDLSMIKDCCVFNPPRLSLLLLLLLLFRLYHQLQCPLQRQQQQEECL
eukprot:m.322397 g.322397  ORF g.322397 m.322397 type:complete len:92 (-) comp26905_c0_seq1:101-376(-)